MGNNRNLQTILPVLAMFLGMLGAGRLMSILLSAVVPLSSRWVSDLAGWLVSVLTAAVLYRFITPPEERPPAKRDILCPLLCVPAYIGLSLTLLILSMGIVSLCFPQSMEDNPISVPLVLTTVLIHPIGEEYVFRGLFLRKLMPSPPASDMPDTPIPAPTAADTLFATLTQAVLFALVHSGMLYGLCGGVVLGLLMQRTGRLWVCVTVHMLINLRTVLWPILPVLLQTRIDGIFISIGLLCGLFLWLYRRRTKPAGQAGKGRHGT